MYAQFWSFVKHYPHWMRGSVIMTTDTLQIVHVVHHIGKETGMAVILIMFLIMFSLIGSQK